jgi:hypothetical protein
MHDKYLFGKDFQRSFIALEDNRPVNLPTQTPTIYIFDEKPSREDAASGTGAVATVSAWNEGTVSPYPNVYTVTGINDPDADSDVSEYWYWEAINYITKTAGTVQTKVRAFKLVRAGAPSTLPSLTSADLQEVYPELRKYLSDDELAAVIENCTEQLIIDLEAGGLQFEKFSDLKKLRLPLAFKCIAESSLSQFKVENDRFFLRYQMFNEKYSNLLKQITLPYDEDGDGQAEKEEKPKRSYQVYDT